MTPPKPAPRISDAAALAPFKAEVWTKLSPAERLRRSWALRKRLPDLRAVHDRKLFPEGADGEGADGGGR